MEVSALKYSGGIRLHGRSSLLRLQSDERLVMLVRKGNQAAFEVLVGRYESRLLAFCRHMLGSREDAEDVLQEVFSASFNALLADDRPINVRPWLFRIARNRSLNHLRKAQAIGVDSMDVHLSDFGATTADKVNEREEFRLLVGDIHELPETQKTALVLREMDNLSYEQIAEVMETTVPSVKSLLVRARVSLAEAAEARLLSCDEVRIELGEVAEGLLRRPSPLVKRHLKACERCTRFQTQLKQTNRALAALLPIGPLALLRKFAFIHLGHSSSSAAAGSGAAAAGSGAAAASSGAAAAGSGAAVGSSIAAAGSSAGGFITAGLGAVATKAAVGLAAAALVTGAAVEVDHSTQGRQHHHASPVAQVTPTTPTVVHSSGGAPVTPKAVAHHKLASKTEQKHTHKTATKKSTSSTTPELLASTNKPPVTPVTSTPAKSPSTGTTGATSTTLPGRTQSQTDPTVLSDPTDTSGVETTAPASPSSGTTGSTGPAGPVATAPVIPPPDGSTGSTGGTTDGSTAPSTPPTGITGATGSGSPVTPPITPTTTP
jgi:RNA polymerase sigma factor (sigma-70 family)